MFVGTVLDVWHFGDRQVARFVVERPARGTRIGEIIGVVDRSGTALGGRIGAGERWMIVADAVARGGMKGRGIQRSYT